jgi:cerevisin
LLSIYPSVTFDPPEAKTDIEETIFGFKSETYSKLTQLAKSVLPGWMTIGLYAEEQFVAPVPSPPVLTPTLLKKALLALSTKDALSSLPAKTVNLLIFNNATDIGSYESFWSRL